MLAETDIWFTDSLGRKRRRANPSRLLNRVRVEGECWVFTGHTNRRGYGRFNALGNSLAHRVSWILHHGPIPDGMLVCHRCDNPPCINPAHLFIGAHSDNMRDMVAKGRSRDNANERSGKAKLSDAQVAEIRQRRASGEYLKDIATDFDIHPAHAGRICRGLRRPFGSLTILADES